LTFESVQLGQQTLDNRIGEMFVHPSDAVICLLTGNLRSRPSDKPQSP